MSLIVGLLLGLLVGLAPSLPLSSDLQKLVLVIPFALTVVILFNNLEKLILAAIAIGVPLNLDFSLLISPYARNLENIASGNRTIVALTELRISLILIVVVIGYAVWLIERPGAGRQPIHFFPSASIPALGFIFFSILSMTQAQDVQLSFFRIVQLVELFLAYFYLANHIRTKQDLQFFVIALMVGLSAESILMIVQWFTGFSFSMAGIEASYEASSGRPGGTLGQPDAAGGIIAGWLAIVLAMIWLFPRRSQKAFAVICFVVGCIALISTASRAAWGSIIVVIFGFMLIGWRRGWVQGRSLVLIFITTLVIGGIFFPTIYNRLTADDRGSAASRPKMFRLAWNVISSSPSHLFLGVGANNYALVAPAYNTSDVGNLGYVINSSVHNVYLLAWAETGLIGMLCFLGFLAVPLLKAWEHIRSDNRFFSLIALGLGCAILAMAIQMLVAPFIGRPINIFVWLLISLIVSLDHIESMPVGPLIMSQV